MQNFHQIANFSRALYSLLFVGMHSFFLFSWIKISMRTNIEITITIDFRGNIASMTDKSTTINIYVLFCSFLNGSNNNIFVCKQDHEKRMKREYGTCTASVIPHSNLFRMKTFFYKTHFVFRIKDYQIQ